MAGMSAGLICWFEEWIDASQTGKPTPMRNGLGFLNGSASPHFDVSQARHAGYRSLVKLGMLDGYGLDEISKTRSAPRWSARAKTRRPIASRAAPMARQPKKSWRRASSARARSSRAS
jgi:dipeptidase E